MALLGTLINKFGKIAGWNSVKVVMLGRQVEGITALSYKDSKEKDNIYGAGEFPVGRGEGNYKAEASITLLKEEVNALQLTLGSGNIPVMYEYKGLVMKDVIRNVEFTDNGVDVKQGDKSIATQFTLLPSHIDWNVAM
ncbi:hypothetical protein GAC71_21940 [Bacteroides thetaiotaomicron]|nr:hypothetical protein GAC71_21940 [Bacteroides thetaiotaomicron]